MELESEPYPKRRIDAMTALMTLVTLLALAGAAWLRFGRPSSSESSTATVGAEAPPLRLTDLETAEPIVLIGVNDKVAWVIFWSAGAPSGRACLAELSVPLRRLRMHRRFALVPAAIELDDPAKVRAAVRDAGFPLPVYLTGPETRRRFHVEDADPPLHVLIDAGGRILAMARGGDPQTIARVAEIAGRRLEEIDPLGELHFAADAIHRR